MKKVSIFCLLVVALTVPARAQNILLMTVESCRADRLPFPERTDLSPNIDRWARSAVVFENAYAVSSWAAPSIVSIMTGLYPSTHGVSSRGEMGLPDLSTLPRLLSKKGYRVPNLNSITDQPYYRHLGFTEKGIPEHLDLSDEGRLIAWLEKEAVSGDGRPFFAWVHSSLLKQPYRDAAGVGFPSPGKGSLSDAVRAVVNGKVLPIGAVRFQPEDRQVLDRLYDSRVSTLDQVFGRILETLQRKEVLEETLLIFVGTHGVELLDHGYFGEPSTSLYAKLYQEMVRVPLIISWPDGLPQGTRDDRRASQLDLFPTLLQLLDLPLPARIHGQDLFDRASASRTLFFEAAQAGAYTSKEEESVMLRSVLRDRYKYLDSDELYDLKEDPMERTNLAEKKVQLTRRLRSEISAWLAACREDQSVLSLHGPQQYNTGQPEACPVVVLPRAGTQLDYDEYTGAVLLEWTGNKSTTYYVHFSLGTGEDHFVGGSEVEGNFLVVGPFGKATWNELKMWNPIRIRVTPRKAKACWSEWVEFEF